MVVSLKFLEIRIGSDNDATSAVVVTNGSG